jgi:hypothetical protein
MEEKEGSSSNQIFNISLEKFKELSDLKVSLDELYILEQFHNRVNVRTLKGARVEALIQGLHRKGYLLSNDELSSPGQALVVYSRQAAPMKELIAEDKAKEESAFEKWWKAYPATDIFEYRGRRFTGTRGFRVKKEECKLKFQKILQEGEYSGEDLVRALEYEVAIKKEASFKEGENKMRYMQSTLPYLNQRTFENFVEISKQPLQATRSSGTDI